LERFKFQIKFDFKKREVDKIFQLWKESRMSMSLYFHHNFSFKYHIALILVALEI